MSVVPNNKLGQKLSTLMLVGVWLVQLNFDIDSKEDGEVWPQAKKKAELAALHCLAVPGTGCAPPACHVTLLLAND